MVNICSSILVRGTQNAAKFGYLAGSTQSPAGMFGDAARLLTQLGLHTDFKCMNWHPCTHACVCTVSFIALVAEELRTRV